MSKILRVTIGGFMFGQSVQNRLHFIYEDDTNLLYLQDMAANIETSWIQILRPAINSDVFFQFIRVDDLSAGPIGPTFTKQIAVQGSASSDAAAPPFFCVVLQLQTGERGRRSHGRIMIAGQSPGQFSSGVMNSLGLARWTGVVDNLNRAYLKGGNLNQGNASLILSSGNHGIDQIREVKSIVLRTTAGTQNTRKMGVGS